MVNLFRQFKDNTYNSIQKCYGLMATAELEEMGLLKLVRYPQLALRGRGSLVAVIDTGINLRSPLFRYENGTSKVAVLWDQSDSGGPAPAGFSYGREWTREEISRALRTPEGAEMTEDAGMSEGTGAPEDARMSEGEEMPEDAGIPEAAASTNRGSVLPADEEGHGTFLAAIAAGREDAASGFMGAAPDSDLLIVKLRQADPFLKEYYSIPENVWACQEEDVIQGIQYVLEMGSKMDRPVSICLGIGTNMGGHDGTAALDRFISETSLMTGISVHVPAGNEEISAHHFHGIIEEGKPYASVNFNVADKENGFVMELWGQPPFIYTMSFTSPGGENVDRLQLKQGELRRIEFFPEETILEIQSFLGESISGDQVIRMRFINPAPGAWQLRVHPDPAGGRQLFDLWMPISNFLRDETFFLNASADETVTSPGNAVYSITYTPYDINNNSLYLRAGRGFTRDGRIKPDLAAPGVSVSVPSDIPGGRPVTRSGSSIAAAYGAGLGALVGEWAIVKGNDPYYNGQKLRYYLIQGAERTGAFQYPNREWGYGMVNIYNAFLSLRR